jgi:hypothetical protein
MTDRGYCTGVLDATGRVVPPVDPEETRFEHEISLLFDTGITRGCGEDRRFCPNDLVTRAEMAAFIARSLRYLGIDPIGPSADRFPDDDDSIHETDINLLAGAGIIRGHDDGRFRPDDPTTRAQAASLLVRAFGLAPSRTDWFSDDADSIHQADINSLAAAGVTRGCGEDRFCPGQALTRGEVAALLARALDL